MLHKTSECRQDEAKVHDGELQLDGQEEPGNLEREQVGEIDFGQETFVDPGQEVFPETGLEDYVEQEEEFPENEWDWDEVDN